MNCRRHCAPAPIFWRWKYVVKSVLTWHVFSKWILPASSSPPVGTVYVHVSRGNITAWGSVETLLESSVNWLMQGVTDVQDWVSWAQRVGFSQHSLLSRLLGMKYLEGEKLLKLWKSFYPDPDRQRSLWCDKWHLTPREEHPLKKQLVSRANL